MPSVRGKGAGTSVDFLIHIILVLPKKRWWLKGSKIKPKSHLNRKQTVFTSADDYWHCYAVPQKQIDV